MSDGTLVHVNPKHVLVEEGHNPRTQFEVKKIEELAASIATRGLLSPIVIREQEGQYFLVAGERRLRASIGVLDSIPAIVQNGMSADPGERTVDALVENVQREDISISDEVRAYARLKDQYGWSAKRIAHETGLPQRRITVRMALLALPDEVIDQVADYPDSARKALLAIAEQSKDIAQVVAEELAKHPAIELKTFGKQPADWLAKTIPFSKQFPVLVYGYQYDHAKFELEGAKGEKVKADAGDFGLFFAFNDGPLKQAKSLSATTKLGDIEVVIGWDVANHLATEGLHKQLVQREKQREEIKASFPSSGGVTDGRGNPIEKPTPDERKAEYAKQMEERKRALEFNDAAGAVLMNKLASVELTAPVARLLSALILEGKAVDYYMRGLRYMHPSARTEAPKSTKYADRDQSQVLLDQWLSAGRKAEEIIGRTLVLVAAARIADTRAVAQSNRTGRSVYGGELGSPSDNHATVLDELDKLIGRALPKNLSEAVEGVMAECVPTRKPQDEVAYKEQLKSVMGGGDPGPEDPGPEE